MEAPAPTGAEAVINFAKACRKLHIRAAACRGSRCVALSEIRKDSDNLYEPFLQTLRFIYRNWSQVVQLYILNFAQPEPYPAWYTALASALSYFVCPCEVNARDMPYVTESRAIALDPKRVQGLTALAVEVRAFQGALATSGTVFGLVEDVLQNNARARQSLRAALYETRNRRQKLLSTTGNNSSQIRALLQADLKKPASTDSTAWSPVMVALLQKLLTQPLKSFRSRTQGPAPPKKQRGLQGSANSCYVRALMQCLSCCFNAQVVPPEGQKCAIVDCVACAVLSLSDLVQGNATEFLAEDGELFKRIEKAASHVQEPDDPQQALHFIWESLQTQLEDNQSTKPHTQLKRTKELWFSGQILYLCEKCNEVLYTEVHTWPALDRPGLNCTHLNTTCIQGDTLETRLTLLTTTQDLKHNADNTALQHRQYDNKTKCPGRITSDAGMLFSADKNPRFAMIWFIVEYGKKRTNPPLQEVFKSTYAFNKGDPSIRSVEFRVVAMVRYVDGLIGHYTTLRRNTAGHWYHADNTEVMRLAGFAEALKIATGPGSWIRMILLEKVTPKKTPVPALIKPK